MQDYLQWTVDARKALRRINNMGDPAKDGFSYECIEDYVLQHGRAYASEALTHEELSWLFKKIDACRSRFAIKQCFYNSQMLLLRTKAWSDNTQRLEYVEGYASGIIPVHHGWLSLNGKVIDLTLRLQEPFRRSSPVGRTRLRNRVLGEFPEDRSYFGVTFTDAAIRQRLQGGYCGSLIDDWQNGYPLLRATRAA